VPGDVRERSYWREGAASVLLPLFVAGAYHPARPGDLSVVCGWLTEWQVEEPLQAPSGRWWPSDRTLRRWRAAPRPLLLILERHFQEKRRERFYTLQIPVKASQTG
jgi:hypothetical protein